jgi:hypothetical protein
VPEPVPCHVCRKAWMLGKRLRVRNATTVVSNMVGMRIALCDEHTTEMRALDTLNKQFTNIYRKLYPGEAFTEITEPVRLPSPPKHG